MASEDSPTARVRITDQDHLFDVTEPTPCRKPATIAREDMVTAERGRVRPERRRPRCRRMMFPAIVVDLDRDP